MKDYTHCAACGETLLRSNGIVKCANSNCAMSAELPLPEALHRKLALRPSVEYSTEIHHCKHCGTERVFRTYNFQIVKGRVVYSGDCLTCKSTYSLSSLRGETDENSA